MGSFDIVILEGVFYTDVDGSFVVQDESYNIRDVGEELARLKDQKIILSIHYKPLKLTNGEWGFGSCLWKGYGECPSGHHHDPLFMMSLSKSGTLAFGSSEWRLEEGGEATPLPLAQLEGHRWLLVGYTDPRQQPADGNTASQLERLGELRDIFTKFQELLKTL